MSTFNKVFAEEIYLKGVPINQSQNIINFTNIDNRLTDIEQNDTTQNTNITNNTNLITVIQNDYLTSSHMSLLQQDITNNNTNISNNFNSIQNNTTLINNNSTSINTINNDYLTSSNMNLLQQDITNNANQINNNFNSIGVLENSNIQNTNSIQLNIGNITQLQNKINVLEPSNDNLVIEVQGLRTDISTNATNITNNLNSINNNTTNITTNETDISELQNKTQHISENGGTTYITKLTTNSLNIGDLESSIIPKTDDDYFIGSNDKKFKEVHTNKINDMEFINGGISETITPALTNNSGITFNIASTFPHYHVFDYIETQTNPPSGPYQGFLNTAVESSASGQSLTTNIRTYTSSDKIAWIQRDLEQTGATNLIVNKVEIVIFHHVDKKYAILGSNDNVNFTEIYNPNEYILGDSYNEYDAVYTENNKENLGVFADSLYMIKLTKEFTNTTYYKYITILLYDDCIDRRTNGELFGQDAVYLLEVFYFNQTPLNNKIEVADTEIGSLNTEIEKLFVKQIHISDPDNSIGLGSGGGGASLTSEQITNINKVDSVSKSEIDLLIGKTSLDSLTTTQESQLAALGSITNTQLTNLVNNSNSFASNQSEIEKVADVSKAQIDKLNQNTTNQNIIFSDNIELDKVSNITKATLDNLATEWSGVRDHNNSLKFNASLYGDYWAIRPSTDASLFPSGVLLGNPYAYFAGIYATNLWGYNLRISKTGEITKVIDWNYFSNLDLQLSQNQSNLNLTLDSNDDIVGSGSNLGNTTNKFNNLYVNNINGSSFDTIVSDINTKQEEVGLTLSNDIISGDNKKLGSTNDKFIEGHFENLLTDQITSDNFNIDNAGIITATRINTTQTGSHMTNSNVYAPTVNCDTLQCEFNIIATTTGYGIRAHTGDFTNLTTNLFSYQTIVSDENLKENIEPLNASSSIEEIRNIQPSSYSFKNNSLNLSGEKIGFIAQNVAEVNEKLSKEIDFNYTADGVSYNKLCGIDDVGLNSLNMAGIKNVDSRLTLLEADASSIPTNKIIVQSNSNNGGIGTYTAPFNNIQNAINVAIDGSIIFLMRGTYTSGIITTDKNITIEGETQNTVIQNNLTQNTGILFTGLGNLTLRNLTLSNFYKIDCNGLYDIQDCIINGGMIELNDLNTIEGEHRIENNIFNKMTDSDIFIKINNESLNHDGFRIRNLYIKNNIFNKDNPIQNLEGSNYYFIDNKISYSGVINLTKYGSKIVISKSTGLQLCSFETVICNAVYGKSSNHIDIIKGEYIIFEGIELNNMTIEGVSVNSIEEINDYIDNDLLDNLNDRFNALTE